MANRYLPTLFPGQPYSGSLFHSLKDDIDRLFYDFDRTQPLQSQPGTTVFPKLDIEDRDTTVDISVELPGVAADDMTISVHDNVLVLHGEKSAKTDRSEDNLQLVERSYGSFTRRIPFDFRIDPDRVDAAFCNGVLNISIKKPKETEAKSHEIKIATP